MRKRTGNMWWGLFTIGLCAGWAFLAFPVKPGPLPVEFDAGVVQVLARGSEGWSTGTGVAIAPNLIVTAAHVVDDAFTDLPPGALPRMMTAAGGAVVVTYRNTHFDVAVLQAQVPSPAVRELVCRSPVPGERVTVVGFPKLAGSYVPTGAIITSGIIASKPQVGRLSRIQEFVIMETNVSPGNSGGPVFDKDGKVIGIAVAMFGNEREHKFVKDGYSMMVPANVLCRLMGRT